MLLFGTSCADYESGYEQGYKNAKARNWLVLGRKDYKKGYAEGHMQAFQDDWYAENEDEIVSGLSCPTILLRTNPVTFINRLKLGEFN